MDTPLTEAASLRLLEQLTLFAFSKVGRLDGLAQDFAAEVLTRYMEQEKPIAAPRAWCFRVLRNLIIDHQRRVENRLERQPLADCVAEQPEAYADLDRRLLTELLPEVLERMLPRSRRLLVDWCDGIPARSNAERVARSRAKDEARSIAARFNT